ncbi:metalloregulator ArsR/SmtB family transcription factor [Streptomyces sp. NPDC046237]|uniref:ArsR/SmtB family transcription factor n=1 Tax=Streptomyces sp. NPDC046237 TaxID=3154914 RepID=UPI003406DF98
MAEERDAGVLGDVSSEILDQAAAIFGVLASPVRLRILRVLSRGESDVAHLAEQVGGALSTISQHLSALMRSGLVDARRDGRRRVYFIADSAVVEVVGAVVERVSGRADARSTEPGHVRGGAP